MVILSPLAVLALALGLAPARPPAIGSQDAAGGTPGAALVVRGEKLYIRPGEMLENGAALIRDGRIVAVGKELVAPEGTREIAGKVVCAGFVDAWSVFGLDSESVGDERSSAATRAADAFNPYLDPRLKREVLRAGVTTYRTQAAGNARVPGIGVLLRNRPDSDRDRAVLLGDCCVEFTIGLGRNGRGNDVFERLNEVDRVVGAITDGLAYLQDKVEYQHDLEEWQKTITAKQKELDDGFKKAKKDREKEEADAKEKGKEFKEKAYKEDKKPKPPRYDEDKEIMARVANGELPLVVEAHRTAELRGLLEGTERFERLRLVIAGGTEAMTVAHELASRGVPVIVWPIPVGEPRPEELRNSDLALAGQLEAAGVQVLLGSGGSWPSAMRDLPLLAALAVGHGLDKDAALAALTERAARTLDVDDRVGTIEAGKDADLIVLDGEPLAATTHVRFVISAGDVVLTPED